MVDNQHKKITGYRDLSEDEIKLMNDIKEHEKATAHLWARVADRIYDAEPGRQCSIARTEFEHAFMRLVRAVAKPVTNWSAE